MRFVRRVSTSLLLLPALGWSLYAFAADKPWSLALNQTASAMYVAWAIGIGVLYVVVARD